MLVTKYLFRLYTVRPNKTHTHTHTHTHTFNGPFSGTIRMSRYQKGKTNLDFSEARDSDWQWHQLGHMQVCILLQTDNHTSISPLFFYRPDALPAAQPTASKQISTLRNLPTVPQHLSTVFIPHLPSTFYQQPSLVNALLYSL